MFIYNRDPTIASNLGEDKTSNTVKTAAPRQSVRTSTRRRVPKNGGTKVIQKVRNPLQLLVGAISPDHSTRCETANQRQQCYGCRNVQESTKENKDADGGFAATGKHEQQKEDDLMSLYVIAPGHSLGSVSEASMRRSPNACGMPPLRGARVTNPRSLNGEQASLLLSHIKISIIVNRDHNTSVPGKCDEMPTLLRSG
jgi:hypothetical protein